MSHELRTPLNSVIGFANIVRRNSRGALSDADLTYLDRIAENGRQLLRTINSILDLSKIEAEQESVELELVSVDHLVREVVAQLEPQAVAGQVALVADLGDVGVGREFGGTGWGWPSRARFEDCSSASSLSRAWSAEGACSASRCPRPARSLPWSGSRHRAGPVRRHHPDEVP